MVCVCEHTLNEELFYFEKYQPEKKKAKFLSGKFNKLEFTSVKWMKRLLI